MINTNPASFLSRDIIITWLELQKCQQWDPNMSSSRICRQNDITMKNKHRDRFVCVVSFGIYVLKMDCMIGANRFNLSDAKDEEIGFGNTSTQASSDVVCIHSLDWFYSKLCIISRIITSLSCINILFALLLGWHWLCNANWYEHCHQTLPILRCGYRLCHTILMLLGGDGGTIWGCMGRTSWQSQNCCEEWCFSGAWTQLCS